MSRDLRYREPPGACGWCGKPTRNQQHEDGTSCLATCPRCNADVVYNIGGDCLDHPDRASWEACRDVVGGPGIFAQVAL